MHAYESVPQGPQADLAGDKFYEEREAVKDKAKLLKVAAQGSATDGTGPGPTDNGQAIMRGKLPRGRRSKPKISLKESQPW